MKRSRFNNQENYANFEAMREQMTAGGSDFEGRFERKRRHGHGSDEMRGGSGHKGGPRGRGRGPGGRGRGRGPGGRPQRARRGDARLAILSVLEAAPSNGYGIIQAIAERTDDAWKPSPGSIYPTLELLTDEGLVEQSVVEASADGESNRGEFQLTGDGRTYVNENKEEINRVWQSHPASSSSGKALRNELHAIRDVMINFRFASDSQREAAAKELARTRRALFAILAEESD